MSDTEWMQMAIDCAASARLVSRPNPWVGAVVVTADGSHFTGATRSPGNAHAEIVAMDHAGDRTVGATLYSTLEPCSHHGRTPPCAEAIVARGIARVVVGLRDPDHRVSGSGIAALERAGIDVEVGVLANEVQHQLAPYLHHRSTGKPWVVAKMAMTIDGRIAARDGSSRWITGDVARQRVHQLRAESDAILVGAGTVRADDPELTTRHVDGPSPRRVVLGSAPRDAKVHPCLEWTDSLPNLLDTLGGEGVLQLLVEGGPRVLRSFHDERLVDQYVFHLAPTIAGGGDAPGPFAGEAIATIADLWRGRFVSVRPLGNDLEVIIEPLRNETSNA
ncbi:MAG: bifunctional diaminohydroxyphosphoribosylaminopyrimidine deaminase/5-amino-6-(5-phosphoribosylamino)uracil reductase RibD [Ilumatobacteraceae bacterium]